MSSRGHGSCWIRAAVSTTALVWLLAPWCGGVAAQAPAAAVKLHVEKCDLEAPAIDLTEVIALLRVELAPTSLEVLPAPSSSARGDGLSVRACGGELATLSYRDGAREVARTVTWGELAPETHARALAMLLAELVGEVERETAAPMAVPEAPPPSVPTSTAAAVDPEPSASEVEARPKQRRRARAMARLYGEARAFASPATIVAGPRVAFALARLQLSGAALFGHASNGLGEITFGATAAAVSYQLWIPARLPLLSLSAAGELGADWARGQARQDADARAKAAFAARAALELVLRSPVRGAWQLEVLLALGYAHGLIATSDGEVEARLSGPFVGLSFGVGLPIRAATND